MRIRRLSDVVYAVAGTNVNWALLCDDSGITVVDAGYPADGRDVLESVRRIGQDPADIAAVLITHAHLDHVGGLPELLRTVPVPVYTGAEEARHARREYKDQVAPTAMLAMLRTGRGRRWVAQTLRATAGRIDVAVPTATTATDDVLAALPGSPVIVPTPGHTPGHTAYLADGVLLSGDALVTGHPLSTCSGPQLLPSAFTHDDQRTRASALSLLDVPARLLLPGHGEPERFDPERIADALAGRP